MSCSADNRPPYLASTSPYLSLARSDNMFWCPHLLCLYTAQHVGPAQYLKPKTKKKKKKKEKEKEKIKVIYINVF
jgi:hypothetical protein